MIMALTIKRQILSQLARLGLGSELSNLKLVPPELAVDAVGQTFSINLPADAQAICQKLSKSLRSEPSFIENVAASQASQVLLKINFEFIVRTLLLDLRRNLLHSGNQETKRTTIVEYSSPNIAKPFHVGNFRSTIIGNSVAKILEASGQKVIRMNYLGDWGTQFGILSLAYELFGDNHQLEKAPLKHLFDVYVRGNQEIKSNPELKEAAKSRFTSLESRQDSKLYEQWQHFRDMSLNELRHLYDRLGVTFDHYTSESMFSQSSLEIVDKLNQAGLLERDETGALYVSCSNDARVPVLKSDGSTLYITRDVAAVLQRKEVFNFDQMLYVVDSSQSKHFGNLKSILCVMGSSLHSDIHHVKFGRIIGMSTRKGEVIFLDDLLNQAKELALQAIKNSSNTKIEASEFDRVADVLGVSALIVHDLSNRRAREYRFNWEKALKLNGNTGISLQYTHARLCNLQKNCGVHLGEELDRIDVGAIDTPSGRVLICQLCMLDEVLDQACRELEPSVIAEYLFRLKSAINRANQDLNIKSAPSEIAHTRLLLFHCAHNVLHHCMRLLGLEPLESM